MWFNPYELLLGAAKSPANPANPAISAICGNGISDVGNKISKISRISSTNVAQIEDQSSKILTAYQQYVNINQVDKDKLVAYLVDIGESDQAIEVLVGECSGDPDKLVYFLGLADKAKDDASKYLSGSTHGGGNLTITCRTCLHFKFFNQASRGAGSCIKGVQPLGACWWGDTEHLCKIYFSRE